MDATTATTGPVAHAQTPDPDGGWYDGFRERLQGRFAAAGWPLYQTDATGPGLWAAYLAALPEGERQHYTCHTCRHFVERFGGIVAIDERGRTTPALWSDAEEGWHGDAIRAMHRIVRGARVVGVFVPGERILGSPVTGAWRHMAATVAREHVHKGALRNADQRAAELREDYGTLCRGLAKTTAEHITSALKLFRDGSLGRPERFEEMAAWALALIQARAAVRGPARDNLAWRAVATAPAGWAHIGNTVLGTVLEDLAAGLSFEQIKGKMDAKLHPLHYQRPQAPPTAGAIAQAEAIFGKLGLAPALRRRFARVDEVPMIWTPRTGGDKPAAEGAVFGHLTPKGKAPKSAEVVGEPTTITWDKFRRTVLGDALAIEYRVEAGATGRWSPFAFGRDGLPIVYLTTACDPEAPPLLQWDRPERRNPVAWYLYHGGSAAGDVGLTSGAWHPVVGVTTLPPTWDPEHPCPQHGDGAILVLRGARDGHGMRRKSCGTGLFPECLRGELREVRSVIEDHEHTTAPEDGERDDLAIGVDIRKGGTYAVRVRVRTALGLSEYLIDRWD